MATIRDVAKLAGVSVSTVSLALNTAIDDHRVSPTTWMKVHNAVDALNYTPSTAARHLRKNEKEIPVIGIFWPDTHQMSNLGESLKSIQEAFEAAYYTCYLNVFIFRTGELKNFRQLLDQGSLTGAIIVSADMADLEWLKKEEIKVPLVLFNRQVLKYSFVRAHNREMGREAAKIILDAGIRSIALFRIKEPGHGQRRRVEDFIRAYAAGDGHYSEYIVENKVEPETLTRKTEDMIRDGGYEAAVFFMEEQVAYSSIYTMLRNRIRIPEDMRVLQVNLSFGRFYRSLSPSLSAVYVSSDEMLQDCVRILLHQIKNPDTLPVHKMYSPSIAYGETFPRWQETAGRRT